MNSGGMIATNAFFLIAAAAMAAFVCANALKIGTALGVLSEPDTDRRLHRYPTPQIGGMAILAGLLIMVGGAYTLSATADVRLLAVVGLCGLGIGAVGFADDQTGLSPGARIIMIFVFAGAAFWIDPEMISPTLNWGSFVPTSIPAWLYLPLLALMFGGLVNSANMADGQDGIVGSMFVVWTACLALVSSGTSRDIALVLCVSSTVFLGFNLRGKLFLGDCGSYGVTFVIGLLATLAHARGQLSIETIMVWFFIPVADCLRLLITRPLRGMSPFLGDRDHFHHRLELKMGKQKGLACYASTVTASSIIATLAPRFALVDLCILSAFYFSFAWLTDSTAATPIQARSSFTDHGNMIAINSNRSSEDRRQGAA